MIQNVLRTFLIPLGLLAIICLAASVSATPVKYVVDSTHTYPSFAADHIGLSVWRGKFNRTTGTITFDRAAKTGSVNIVVDMASADFGLTSLNKAANGPKLFDVERYPRATYRGKLVGFVNGAPTRVIGNLTLHGITRPLGLKIETFKCIPAPLLAPRERCGAEAVTHFERDAFGLDFGKAYGFDMTVTLHIQVEALSTKPVHKET